MKNGQLDNGDYNSGQLMKSNLKVVEAENARLKCELEEKKQLTKSLLEVIGVVKDQQMSTTNMQPLLAQIKLVAEGFVSLNQKVAELQQNITQPPGTHVYAQPWQPQHNVLTNQGSQAVGTTLPLTQLAGTNRVRQTFQTPGTFIEDSHGLPDFLLQEQLGQTAHTNDVSLDFSLHQGQGRNTAGESQPFTQGLSDQDADIDEFFSSLYQPRRRLLSLSNADTDKLKEKQELCQEDQQMKFNIEAFEAENKRLEREIKEKERQMKFNLRAFLVDYRIFKHQLQEKEILMMMFEYQNGQLEPQMEEEERFMKSNTEAFEAEDGRLKLEIGEKEQPTKSNLGAFEAQNERLKHEIQAKEQLVKSNLETLEAQIRQLVDEFESQNVANVAVNRRMQDQSGEITQLEINFDKFKLN